MSGGAIVPAIVQPSEAVGVRPTRSADTMLSAEEGQDVAAPRALTPDTRNRAEA